ncbi:MAG: tetratricopeptide repeat protein [Acidobacteria bacterium]|nr:tetratricopeptide repeat protein [Acidobacteriota bacterium]
MARSARRLSLLSAVLVLGVLVGCPNGSKKKGQPIILVVIDTLRADHLPNYGYTKIQTPHLNDLNRDSLRFENVFAQVPLTLPSHASLFTGKLPFEHGVRDNAGYKLDGKVQTLASHLKDAGYQTAGFVSSMVLRSETGINQGFDLYDDHFRAKSEQPQGVTQYAQRGGEETMEHALDWLAEQGEEPFFLFIHLYDPHTPYDPPEPYSSQASLPYDGEILLCDDLIGRLIGALKQKGLYQNCVLSVTSDHGEGLGDHGEEEHGFLLYRETLSVPLWIKYPNQLAANTTEKGVMALTDVAGAISAAAGVPMSKNAYRPLSSFSHGPVYSESLNAALHFGWYEQFSVVEGDKHFIKGDRDRAFNFITDPNEKTPLSPMPTPPSNWSKWLALGSAYEKPGSELSAEEKEMLASLGYAGDFAAGQDLRELDESQFLQLFNKIKAAGVLVGNRQYAQVLPFLQEILQQHSGMLDVRLLLGTCLTGMGRYEQAEYLYLEGLSQSPNDLSLLVGLINSQFGLQKKEKIPELIDRVFEISPHLGARMLLPILIQNQEFKGTEQAANAILNQTPEDGPALFAKGWLAHHQQAYAQAEEWFRQALENTAPENENSSKTKAFLADCLANQGQLDRALALFEESIAQNPHSAFAQSRRALTLFSMNQPQLAVKSLNDWLAMDPTEANVMAIADVLTSVGLQDMANQLKADWQKSQK